MSQGVLTADPRWQSGYEDGFEDACPRSIHPAYKAGWLTGYMGGEQCSAADSDRRWGEHQDMLSRPSE